MTAPDLHRIEVLFQEAADLPPARRGPYLATACGDDADLRCAVDRLLDRLDEPDNLTAPLLAAGRAGPFLTAPVTEVPGAVVDRYKLLQVIGEGGFGVVYMAEQQRPVVRKVALKVIKLGMDTREVVARFEAERQALALMDHPNIARVLDGGATASGRPYFVMELVRGVSITTHCDRAALDTVARLQLFLQVCQAVQHAHHKGVIHRDIKPSNVLVTGHDGEAMPKVIDFGVAKAMHTRLTEKTLFTRYEQFLGTPAYMSPEQAELSALDIDTRTDVYALGVLLYELLTGTTPFEPTSLQRAGLAEIQRIIREEHPARPSLRISSGRAAGMAAGMAAGIGQRPAADRAALSRRLRGDLDWIVMKALEKDRSRRYSTVNELADDVRRHLRNETVSAGPPGATYRLAKFLSRNRAGVTTAVLVTLALIAGIIGTTAAMLRANRHAAAAQLQTARAYTALDFLLSTLSLTNPEMALDPDVTVDRLLEHTSAHVNTVFADDPWAAVRVRSTIGRAYARLGEDRLAEPHLREAAALVDERLAPDGSLPEAALRAGFTSLEHYVLRWKLTNTAFNLSRGDCFAVANRAQAVGFACLAEAYPQVTQRLRTLTDVVDAHAWSPEAAAMGPVDALCHDAVRAADAALAPNDPKWCIVSDALLAAGYMVWYTPHEPHAEVFWGEALRIQRRELPPDHPDIGTTVSLLVGVLTNLDRADEAEALIRESIAALRRVHRDGAIAVASAEAMLGETLVRQGRFAEAEPVLLRSHAHLVDNLGDPSNWRAIESYVRLIALYDGAERPDDAVPYRSALVTAGIENGYPLQWELIRHAFGVEQAALQAAGDALKVQCRAISYTAAPGIVEAPDIGPALDAFITLRERDLPARAPEAAAAARLLLGWANALSPARHGMARARMADEAAAILEHWRDRLPLDYAEARALQALFAGQRGEAQAARRLAQEAAAVIAAAQVPDAWMTASAQVRIGRALLELGLFDAAEDLVRQAHTELSAKLGPRFPDTTVARDLVARLDRERGAK